MCIEAVNFLDHLVFSTRSEIRIMKHSETNHWKYGSEAQQHSLYHFRQPGKCTSVGSDGVICFVSCLHTFSATAWPSPVRTAIVSKAFRFCRTTRQKIQTRGQKIRGWDKNVWSESRILKVATKSKCIYLFFFEPVLLPVLLAAIRPTC